MRRVVAISTGVVLLAACAGPQRPHGPPRVEFPAGTLPVPSQTVDASRAGVIARIPRHLLVAAIWSSEVAVPIGGQYDYAKKGTKPLTATYDFPAVALPVWEGFSARLRAWGFRVYKDYSDVGNVALIKAPAQSALVLRGHLRRGVHDQLRGNDSAKPGVQAAWLEVDLSLLSPRGQQLWQGRRTAKLKVRASSEVDVLDSLGQNLADQLARDDRFVAALVVGAQSLWAADQGSAR